MDEQQPQLDGNQCGATSKPKSFGLSIILLMASLLILISVLAVFVPPKAVINHRIHARMMTQSVSAEIIQACQASQYPEICELSLMKTPIATKSPGPLEIIEAAMGLSLDGAKESHKLCQSILASSSGNFNLTITARNCLEALSASIRQITRSSNVPLEKRIKDVKAWMSAALVFQTDCNSGLRRLNSTIKKVIYAVEQTQTVMNLSSNALSMADALDTYGRNTTLWRPPRTERSNDSSNVKTLAQKGFVLDLMPSVPAIGEIIPNITVSKDNSSGFSSIQAAVDAAPDDSLQRFVIYIKAGVYKEIVRIPPGKINLMFAGDGADRTVITGSMNAQQPGVGTYGSATVAVNADGFLARDITFENTAGPDGHQAVALRVDGDLSAFQNCAFLGYQDTLYAHSLRQFYRDCRIEGTVDFIFGNSASVFHGCSMLVRPRQLNDTKGEKDAVTAQGRTDPAQSTGFVFWDCSVNGTEEYMTDFLRNPEVHRAYLGRPWKLYSRTIFLRSYLGLPIRPEGWLPWDGDFALDTLYYGEFENYGPGANVTRRVPWSNQVSPLAVGMYSVQSFIQGDEWLQSIG